jgi:hypothetical protein
MPRGRNVAPGGRPPANLHTNANEVSTLYFIRSGDFLKIGLATDVRRRLAHFQLHNPHPIWLDAFRTVPRPLARYVEAQTHAALAEFSLGREWFKVDTGIAKRAAHPIVGRAWREAAKWRDTGARWEIDPRVSELRSKDKRL